MPKSFDKVLIANRGEIAVRVMRTCHEMGICTVAVYSDADRTAPHVLIADEAYHIGKSPARESYLVGEEIIKTALKCNAQAIHPGYGFLSENGDFAESVEAAGLTFIGPPAASIRSMGSKTEARGIMIDAGVPVVPGDKSGIDSPEKALASAEKIGYPVLIKAAMGGGGKGMRVVESAEELPSAFEAARRESLSAFGSDEVYLERYIAVSRHIEIQILADSYGNCVHLYERECSVQRRHQKVIEEAPSPALNEYHHIREQMGEAAVSAALACGYVNAGTVEFLYDPLTNEFYFLEMNTRLQVEHPVTEMVTGIDLVRQQLLIAMDDKLKLRQDDMRHRGHAVECRLYAEDAENGFLPDVGTIKSLSLPNGPWIRVDSGVDEGSEVGVHYDPLIAKLIVWAETRDDAIRRMHRALSEYRVLGFKTNIRFNRWVMDNQVFRSGDFDTGFIAHEFTPEVLEDERHDAELTAAIAAVLWEQKQKSIPQIEINANPSTNGTQNSWKHAGRVRTLR